MPHNRRILFATLWLVFTITFGSWWFYLVLKQARMVAELKYSLGGEIAESSLSELNRSVRMLKWEGVSFLILLGIGGSTLIYLTWRDMQNTRLMNDFFSTVTHEMKTPLASLRLQVESLVEDLKEPGFSRILHRLSGDLVRIESQMEKALYLANMTRSRIVFIEKTSLDEIVESLLQDWPVIHYEKTGLFLKADKKVLEGIFRNLIENSVNHGKADRVLIQAARKTDTVQIQIQDNGSGFSGDIKELGKPFVRHSATSGTGLGIYLVKTLIGRMSGNFSMTSDVSGFHVKISLPVWAI